MKTIAHKLNGRVNVGNLNVPLKFAIDAVRIYYFELVS